jgi:hypothetical protein
MAATSITPPIYKAKPKTGIPKNRFSRFRNLSTLPNAKADPSRPIDCGRARLSKRRLAQRAGPNRRAMTKDEIYLTFEASALL